MKKLALIVTVLFIPALGLQASEDSLSLFAKLDADHNGLLSKEEASHVEEMVALFDILDTDNDGQLSLSEFEAQIKAN